MNAQIFLLPYIKKINVLYSNQNSSKQSIDEKWLVQKKV